MTHPFQAISAENYGLIFLPLFALTLLLTIIFLAIPLRPSIIKFELAGNLSNVRKILRDWDEVGRLKAGFGLGLDFLYLVTYSTTIGLACVWAASLLQSYRLPLASVGILLAWGQWLAAVLDILENIALVTMLFGFVRNPLPQVAKWCAIPKFGLILLGLLYIGASIIVLAF